MFKMPNEVTEGDKLATDNPVVENPRKKFAISVNISGNRNYVYSVPAGIPIALQKSKKWKIAQHLKQDDTLATGVSIASCKPANPHTMTLELIDGTVIKNVPNNLPVALQ